MENSKVLSKAEMKTITGGLASVPPPDCLMECEAVGSICGVAANPGVCTHYPATKDCPNGQNLCVTKDGNPQ